MQRPPGPAVSNIYFTAMLLAPRAMSNTFRNIHTDASLTILPRPPTNLTHSPTMRQHCGLRGWVCSSKRCKQLHRQWKDFGSHVWTCAIVQIGIGRAEMMIFSVAASVTDIHCPISHSLKYPCLEKRTSSTLAVTLTNLVNFLQFLARIILTFWVTEQVALLSKEAARCFGSVCS